MRLQKDWECNISTVWVKFNLLKLHAKETFIANTAKWLQLPTLLVQQLWILRRLSSSRNMIPWSPAPTSISSSNDMRLGRKNTHKYLVYLVYCQQPLRSIVTIIAPTASQTSHCALPTCTPPAMSGLCLLMPYPFVAVWLAGLPQFHSLKVIIDTPSIKTVKTTSVFTTYSQLTPNVPTKAW